MAGLLLDVKKKGGENPCIKRCAGCGKTLRKGTLVFKMENQDEYYCYRCVTVEFYGMETKEED